MAACAQAHSVESATAALRVATPHAAHPAWAAARVAVVVVSMAAAVVVGHTAAEATGDSRGFIPYP
jgi:hypothetical protein